MPKAITKSTHRSSNTSPNARRSNRAVLRGRTGAANGTKQSTAIAMLRSPGGATIDGLMKVTGWQRHSVRGFLAGVVRKRLKLNLNSSLIDGRRVYRVPVAAGPNTVHTEQRNS